MDYSDEKENKWCFGVRTYLFRTAYQHAGGPHKYIAIVRSDMRAILAQAFVNHP